MGARRLAGLAGKAKDRARTDAKDAIVRALAFLRRKLDERSFIYALSLAAGTLSAAAAVILKTSLHSLEALARWASAASGSPWLLALFPLLGIGLTLVWTRFFLRKDIGHGVSRVLEAISRGGGRMERHDLYSSVVACSLTSGFGGSVGMEAPILATGGAVGANIAQAAGLEYRDRVLLIGCGVAGAMGGIFKAPIAGLLFCLEVLSIDAAVSALVPLLISGVTAYLISSFAAGGELVEYGFAIHRSFDPANIPWYLGLGLLCAFVSVWFMRATRTTETFLSWLFPRDRKGSLLLWLAAGVLIGALILLFPAFYGDGYRGMTSLLGGRGGELLDASPLAGLWKSPWALPAFLFLLALLKPFITALTTGSGGIGGVFAPGLFCGAAAGMAFAQLVSLLGIRQLPEANFALAGMAGLIAGTMHAPLTAIFLCAELSNGYQILVPFVLVAAVSYAITRRFEPFSVYTLPLARSGRLITHNKDAAALCLMHLSDYVEAYPLSLRPTDTVADLARAVAGTGVESFPVVAEDGSCSGFASLDDIKPLLSAHELQERIIVADVMRAREIQLELDDPMGEAMRLFASSDLDEIPVFEGGKLKGRLDRGRVFDAYRGKLIELQGR